MIKHHLNLINTLSNHTCAIFRSWWFDPFIASLSFFSSIMIYSYYEMKEGKSCYKNWSEFHWSRGIDKTDARPSLKMSLFAYWVGILIWVQIVSPPSDDDPMIVVQEIDDYDVDVNNDGGDFNTTASFDIASIQTSIPDGIPYSFQSMMYLLLEVVSGILLYDTIFFFIHYAMHECQFVASFTRHFEHHKAAKNLEARHVLRHSLIDGMLQVLVNIAVQRRTPWGNIKSRFARMLHNIIVTIMLTESHSASECPNLFGWWCVGVREHRSHHLSKYHKVMNTNNKDGNIDHVHFHRYQQLFGHWDYIRLQYIKYSSTNNKKCSW